MKKNIFRKILVLFLVTNFGLIGFKDIKPVDNKYLVAGAVAAGTGLAGYLYNKYYRLDNNPKFVSSEEYNRVLKNIRQQEEDLDLKRALNIIFDIDVRVYLLVAEINELNSLVAAVQEDYLKNLVLNPKKPNSFKEYEDFKVLVSGFSKPKFAKVKQFIADFASKRKGWAQYILRSGNNRAIDELVRLNLERKHSYESEMDEAYELNKIKIDHLKKVRPEFQTELNKVLGGFVKMGFKFKIGINKSFGG